MTKKEAIKYFREITKGTIPRGDKPWRAEAWNNFTDYLCKDGLITMKQYETWCHP